MSWKGTGTRYREAIEDPAADIVVGFPIKDVRFDLLPGTVSP